MKKLTAFILTCILLCGMALADSESNIGNLTCGSNSVFVLMDDGKLIAWGDNSNGLIPSDSSSKHIDYKDRCLAMYDAKSVSVGEKCVLAINSSNELFGWGNDGEAALLCGKIHGGISGAPVKLMDDVICASSGAETNAAVTSDGTLYTWGRDNSGSLGIGTLSGSIFREPNKVMKDVSSVYCFGNDAFAIDNDGVLYCWGETFGFNKPRAIAARIVDVAKASGACYLLQNSSNEVLLLQCNSSKDGDADIVLTPSVVTNVTDILNYGYIRKDGTLWMCESSNSNAFVPSAENVSIAHCSDMRYRAYVSFSSLHLEKYEYKMFIEDETHAISSIDVQVKPDSSGIIGVLTIAVLIAAVAIVVLEKPLFFRKIIDAIDNQ